MWSPARGPRHICLETNIYWRFRAKSLVLSIPTPRRSPWFVRLNSRSREAGQPVPRSKRLDLDVEVRGPEGRLYDLPISRSVLRQCSQLLRAEWNAFMGIPIQVKGFGRGMDFDCVDVPRLLRCALTGAETGLLAIGDRRPGPRAVRPLKRADLEGANRRGWRRFRQAGRLPS